MTALVRLVIRRLASRRPQQPGPLLLRSGEIGRRSGNHAVSSAVLCLVEGDIGALEKVIDGFAGLPFGDTEAACDRHLALRRVERQRREYAAQALGVRHSGVERSGLDQDRKLLAAEAADDGGLAPSLVADGAKHLIADVVPNRVIDPLEVVHVEHDRGRANRAGRGRG